MAEQRELCDGGSRCGAPRELETEPWGADEQNRKMKKRCDDPNF
jgi:hypothetical protein